MGVRWLQATRINAAGGREGIVGGGAEFLSGFSWDQPVIESARMRGRPEDPWDKVLKEEIRPPS